MNNNKIYLLYFAIISLGFVASVIFFFDRINMLEDDLLIAREELGIEKANVYDLEKIVSFSFENLNLTIDPNLRVMTEGKDSIFLRELIDKHTVFYRYHASSCFSCIMQITEMINKQPDLMSS